MRVKRRGEKEYFVGRRYGDFSRLFKGLRLELPGKVLPPLPKKNKSSSSTGFFNSGGDDSDAESVSSASTHKAALAPNGGADNSKRLSVRGLSWDFQVRKQNALTVVKMPSAIGERGLLPHLPRVRLDRPLKIDR